jgi:hypothetical protein
MHARNLAATLQTFLALGLCLLPSGCLDSPSRPELARGPSVEVGEPSDPDGPVLTVVSNTAGSWTGATSGDARELFVGMGVRFWWSALPGANGAAITGFSYAVDDTTNWPPYSPAFVEWPEQMPGPETNWYPTPGPHTLFVSAIDEDGLVAVVAAPITFFAGPAECPPEERSILVVLDAAPDTHVLDWFDGYDVQVVQTGGTTTPSVALMNCASTVVWLHGANVAAGESSALETNHAALPNLLAGYRASGGNVLLAGIRPSQAMRFLAPDDGGAPVPRNYPLDLEGAPASFRPHWLLSAGVGRIEGTIGDPGSASSGFALKRATSQVGGANAYPDLDADPAAIPPGSLGIGQFDWGITPATGGSAEVIYEADDTGISVGVRRLTSPGVAGNLVYLGFAPWSVDATAFGELVDAVLHDFGEVPLP